MEKVLLKDLRDRVYKRAALLPIPFLQEILDLSDNFLGDEILEELFTQSLQKFEYYHPLILEMKIYFGITNPLPGGCCTAGCSERPDYYKITDNFKLYLEGRIDEDQIVLVPNSIIGVRTPNSYVSPGNYFRPNDYDRPYLQMAWATGAQYVVRGICSRPLVADYTPDKKFTDKAAIYWLNIREGVLGAKFLDQVLCDILEYIRNLKANSALPNFPIEIFGAVDVQYQQLKQELDQYYLQSLWRGELII